MMEFGFLNACHKGTIILLQNNLNIKWLFMDASLIQTMCLPMEVLWIRLYFIYIYIYKFVPYFIGLKLYPIKIILPLKYLTNWAL